MQDHNIASRGRKARYISCKLSIVRVRGTRLLSRPSEVQVDEVTGRGIRFRSRLRFPADPDILLRFEVSTGSKSLTLEGRIIASAELNDMIWYAAWFDTNDALDRNTIRQMNLHLADHLPAFIQLDRSYGFFRSKSTGKRSVEYRV